MASLPSIGHVPGWKQGIARGERKKKCNYSVKIVSAGILRLKHQLARISGEVAYCYKVPKKHASIWEKKNMISIVVKTKAIWT